MNPSRLFIIRPVATSLLMGAILLSGRETLLPSPLARPPARTNPPLPRG